jgi:hypothetical protein
MTAPLPTEKCRSCGATIVWAINQNTSRPMPVNASPAAGGNLLLVRAVGSSRIVAKTIPAGLAKDRTDLHTSHFSDCPQADDWRTRRDVA